MPSSVERKLTAILSADVVGYSWLMAADEDETVRRFAAYRTEITNVRQRDQRFTGEVEGGVVSHRHLGGLLAASLCALSILAAACSPQVGSEAWCKKMDGTSRGDWSANEAVDYARHCLAR